MRNSLLQWGLKTFQDILLQWLFRYTKISNQLSLKFSNISPENTKSMVQSIGSILFTFSWMKAYMNWTTKVKHSTKIQTQWAEFFFHIERQNNNKTQVNEFGYAVTSLNFIKTTATTANLSQARSNILPQIFFTGCFL